MLKTANLQSFTNFLILALFIRVVCLPLYSVGFIKLKQTEEFVL